MRQSIKITIPKYSVTEFLMKCTDMDVKEKIEETFEAYAKGNITFKNVDLSFNVLNSDEQNEKAPSFVRPSIDLKDPTVVKCVTEYDEYSVSFAMRSIFETAVIIKQHDKLLSNGCLGAIPKQIVNDPTFDEIIDTVKKGTPFETTIAKLLSSMNQKKRTTAFVNDVFDTLNGLSIIITRINGEEVSCEYFKTIKNVDTEIVLKLKDAQKEEITDKAQEMAKTATDDEKTEAADAAEAEGDGEEQMNEGSETSEPEADKKEYEIKEPGDPLEDFSSMRLIS
ncbi:MAG: hypothetical protein IK990_12090 [Ruminiclostridium sp.]|nr:hypothetical protein [Ruminiclostridium sp.]